MLIHNQSIPFNSLSPQHQELIRQATGKWVSWLNEQGATPDGVTPFTIEHFLDPTKNEYAKPRLNFLLEEDYKIILQMFMDDGEQYPLTMHVHARQRFVSVETKDGWDLKHEDNYELNLVILESDDHDYDVVYKSS